MIVLPSFPYAAAISGRCLISLPCENRLVLNLKAISKNRIPMRIMKILIDPSRSEIDLLKDMWIGITIKMNARHIN